MNALYMTTTGDSTITLAQRLDIENYGCGLIEVSGQLEPTNSTLSARDNFFLCSDFVQESFIGQIKLPIIRKIKFSRNWEVNTYFKKIIWLKVEREPISRINLYLTDELGNRVSFKGEGLMCTLLLIPNKSYM
jgi:hypothetical protein